MMQNFGITFNKRRNAEKYLKLGQAPKVSFSLSESDEVVAVYAYCNRHGLWKIYFQAVT